MRRFNIEHIEYSCGPFLSQHAEFILLEALKARLMDEEVVPSQLKPKQAIIKEKTAQYQQKLNVLKHRLQNGFQLIKHQLPT